MVEKLELKAFQEKVLFSGSPYQKEERPHERLSLPVCRHTYFSASGRACRTGRHNSSLRRLKEMDFIVLLTFFGCMVYLVYAIVNPEKF
ncbi:MAG: potassium-transporting ATPase subunit F [Chlorobiaceae bacterium]|nr:potassium-transporting ATPase subunit F [Chlorobiaceae bacterium]